MDKSPEAFRTISEVAESLETPAHVLRFWESRFPQIKPVKRAGGRRYYRPADVALLGGIRHLLHDEGLTIRGVQKILREQGVRHVAAMAAGSEGVDFDADLLEAEDGDYGVVEEADAEPANVFALETAMRPPSPPPAAPAEVVQLRSLPEPLDLPVTVQEAPVVRDLPMTALEVVPAPQDMPMAAPEEVPEAGHIWVEDEPELELSRPALMFPSMQASEAAPEAVEALLIPEGTPPALSGLAARLRALPRPLRPEAQATLLELHSRLGLLHAQMVEAQRLKR